MPQRIQVSCEGCRRISREYSYGYHHISPRRRCKAPAPGARVTKVINGEPILELCGGTLHIRVVFPAGLWPKGGRIHPDHRDDITPEDHQPW